MQTVESIIASVYGTDAMAAERLGVGRTAVSNWKTWGYFPSRLVVLICEHARECQASVDVSEIPTMLKIKAAAAADAVA